MLNELRWKFFTVLLVEKRGEYYSALISSFNFGVQIIFHCQSLLSEARVPTKALFKSHSQPILPFKSRPGIHGYFVYQNYDVHNAVIQFGKAMFMHQMHLSLSTQITITLLLSKLFFSELSKLYTS